MIGLLLWWVVLLVRYRAMLAEVHAQMTGGTA